MNIDKIAVLGAGAWGTALALEFADRHAVSIWARDPKHIEELTREHAGLAASTDMQAVLDGADVIVVAVPSGAVPQLAAQIKAAGASTTPMVLAAKGLDETANRLLSESIAGILPDAPLAILSGPSFASDLRAGMPTAITLALKPDTAELRATGLALTKALASRHFRIYLSDDPIGVQIGGAVKNVIAIACGIAAGRDYGSNTHAALISRGLAEITRLATTLGGRAETMMGLAGVGDLVLTCSNTKSRNYSYGLRRGSGKDHATAMAESAGVVEGVNNTAAVMALAERYGVEMPIVSAVNDLLHHGADLDSAIGALLSRPLKGEGGMWADQPLSTDLSTDDRPA